MFVTAYVAATKKNQQTNKRSRTAKSVAESENNDQFFLLSFFAFSEKHNLKALITVEKV